MSESDKASNFGQKSSVEIGLQVDSQVVGSPALEILDWHRIFLTQVGVENVIPGLSVIDPRRKGKIF